MIVEYDFDIVGGAYDGVPELAWRDDGRTPPPELIYVGVCPRGVHCGTVRCKRAVEHVSYWTPEEQTRPPSAQPYRKQDEFVARDAADTLNGRAVYAVGGLLDPRNFGERARRPEVVGGPALAPAGEVAARLGLGAGWKHLGWLPEGRHDRGWPK